MGVNPLSLQIFDGEKETLVEAAKFVDPITNADIIDINKGCPVNKIIKYESGAKWLLTLIRYMKWYQHEDHIYAVKNAQAFERAGRQPFLYMVERVFEW